MADRRSMGDYSSTRNMLNKRNNKSDENGGERPAKVVTRRRALSLAESQTSVDTVIDKAKRAAQSLWMLLHAQNCVLGQKCPHVGCQEAKLLHLHLKTCTVNGDCPMQYHGCDQSRKLLSHYKRCRSLRAANKKNHYCLVCSLVARQARTMLLKPSSVVASTSLKPSPPKFATVSFCVSKSAPPQQRRDSALKMPPPPPRVDGLDSLGRLYETAKILASPPGGRSRAVSDVETVTFLRRDRSASVGTEPSKMPPAELEACDTILEENEQLAQKEIDLQAEHVLHGS